jgi:fumarylpyruvate hydrolase
LFRIKPHLLISRNRISHSLLLFESLYFAQAMSVLLYFTTVHWVSLARTIGVFDVSQLLFDLPALPAVPMSDGSAYYPVGRIFCVGRNYVEHAIEMGLEVDREAPFYFTKTPWAAQANGSLLAYPPGTENFHYEMELALAIGTPVFRAGKDLARSAIHSYCCALDMTRRDLQLAERAKQRPWDLGKDVEGSAVFAPLTPAESIGDIGPQRIHLALNGDLKQDARLSDMVWAVDEIVSHLSHFYHLRPGDLILTGTPLVWAQWYPVTR